MSPRQCPGESVEAPPAAAPFGLGVLVGADPAGAGSSSSRPQPSTGR